MSGIAKLACEKGFHVVGFDKNYAAPMFDVLKDINIQLDDKEPSTLDDIDFVVIGNASSQHDNIVALALNQNIPILSGPQFLQMFILKDYKTIAISGTHGKSTTTAMLAWLLTSANKDPGFLIGGIAKNFNTSASLGSKDLFVIEADEYDTAFFDKRPKFFHYFPHTLLINNIEFDHADIYQNLNDILEQFTQLTAIVPSKGNIIANHQTPVKTIMNNSKSSIEPIWFSNKDYYHVTPITADYQKFSFCHKEQVLATVDWSLYGEHNANNAMATMLIAKQYDIAFEDSANYLSSFKGVKRRFEKIAQINGADVYDDFAHHPTSIELNIKTLRNRGVKGRLIVVLECGSYTMRTGIHNEKLAQALNEADYVLLKKSKHANFKYQLLEQTLKEKLSIFSTEEEFYAQLTPLNINKDDQIIMMSSQQFDGLKQKLTHTYA